MGRGWLVVSERRRSDIPILKEAKAEYAKLQECFKDRPHQMGNRSGGGAKQFRSGVFIGWSPAPFTAHCYANYVRYSELERLISTLNRGAESDGNGG
jgi:hypothetical protein